MGIITDIRDQSEYKKFKAILIKTREKLQVDRDRAEALSMHAGRSSRRLHGSKQYSHKALIDACLNDLACRSRLVEIRVQCQLQTDLLSEALKSIKGWISTEFYKELGKYKTVGQRNALIERVVSSAAQTEAEGDALVKLLDALIKDIDQASFHLRNMLETLTLLAEKPGQVV